MMSSPRYSLEHLSEIWDNNHGDHLEIGPDRDGLEMVEIRELDSKGKILNRMSFNREQVPLLIQALSKTLEKPGSSDAE